MFFFKNFSMNRRPSTRKVTNGAVARPHLLRPLVLAQTSVCRYISYWKSGWLSSLGKGIKWVIGVYWSMEKDALEMKHIKTEKSLSKPGKTRMSQARVLKFSTFTISSIATHWTINLGSFDWSRFIEHASTAMQMIFPNANWNYRICRICELTRRKWTFNH